VGEIDAVRHLRCCDISARLPALVREQLSDGAHAAALLHRCLHRRTYHRAWCLELIAIARAPTSWTWELRHLATLILEQQLLKLPADDLREYRVLLKELGLVRRNDVNGHVRDGVRKEGYSTTQLNGFVAELRRRLERLERLHLGLDASKLTDQAVRDFIGASRRECKLTLMRYLFTPDEVVERIRRQLKTSAGVGDTRAYGQPDVCAELDRCVERLPAFEAAIAQSLCYGSRIYWVTDATTQRINALVSCPVNTVVAVVRPPGSDVEFELKRVGVKGLLPLGAIFSRDGCEVPPTHRLHGGSMGYFLRWEAGAAAGLSKIYRLIHGVEAPISRSLSVSTVYGVPVNGSEQHVVEYFRRLPFTPGYEFAGPAMQRSVEAFCRESGVVTPPLGGALGVATQFLGQMAPAQSVLTGTTAFRLDRLAAYLSADGPSFYFEHGLRTSCTPTDGKWFADEILEEVLGVVAPHRVRYEHHLQYVDAVLAVRANRERATALYLSIMRDIGVFWGTVLGMRSYSHGESFVARNVGLKSVWENGAWTVKIVFMDHDVLYLTGRMCRDFHPLSAIPGMANDDRHIWGSRNCRGEVELLRQIYRIDPQVESRGHAALREGLRSGYRKTHDAICHDPGVQRCYYREFVGRIADWDQMVIRYLNAKGDQASRDAWREESSNLLKAKGYPPDLMREHLHGVEKHASFLEKYSFVY